MDDSPADGQTPLDDLAYLARSAHRVTVLGQLDDGQTTRRELRESTDISQPTLGRILDGFEERGWATCDRTNGRSYELTPIGELVAASMEDVLNAMDTAQLLGVVADGLPLADMDFDIARFADAEITLPSATDATAHMRREDELIADADRVRFLCSSSYGPGIKAYRDRIVGSDTRFEAVITGDALDAAASDPSSAEWVRDLVGADNVTIYRYDGPVGLILGVIDGITSLVPLDEAGVPRAFIETTDVAIRTWVEDELEAHRESSVRLTPEQVESVAFTA